MPPKRTPFPPRLKPLAWISSKALTGCREPEINLELEGQVLDVFFDGKAGGEGLLQGRTATDKVVIARSTEHHLGKMVPYA